MIISAYDVNRSVHWVLRQPRYDLVRLRDMNRHCKGGGVVLRMSVGKARAVMRYMVENDWVEVAEHNKWGKPSAWRVILKPAQ
jgi:hypothetical protein|tara:strand:+ start:662 stop:910 length:249 start_codon:yes stop_codon:yes gene_type:complete